MCRQTEEMAGEITIWVLPERKVVQTPRSAVASQRFLKVEKNYSPLRG